MRSPEPRRISAAPFAPLLAKELREVLGGRALWIMLLLICPLVGYSFFQALSLYGESSVAARQSAVLAVSLSPFDGILVPTFGAFYVAVTLLFPFVAIRALSHEKESGSLRLLIQLPYRAVTVMLAKALAVMCAWLLASLPVVSAVVIWMMLGGHIAPAETLTLVAGHALYGLLVGAIALFSAAITESAASAAIVTLALTIGSWALDLTIAGRPGLFEWIARLSLTQTLKSFEQGLFSAGLVFGMTLVAASLLALAGIWLRPGDRIQTKLLRSLACSVTTVAALAAAALITFTCDMTEDRRNSFPLADERLLPTLTAPLEIIVHLAPEDPRYVDLQRNVLAKLERAMPQLTIRIAVEARPDADAASYGSIEYRYGTRSDVSRSTSPREILPIIYGLAGVQLPAPVPSTDYPGYPLVANIDLALVWFLGALPLLIIGAWLWHRRPPSFAFVTVRKGEQA